MGRVILVLTSVLLAVTLYGCGSGPAQSQSSQSGSNPQVAKDVKIDRQNYAEKKGDLKSNKEQLAREALNNDEAALDELLQSYKEEAKGLYSLESDFGIPDGRNQALKNSKLYSFCVNLPKGADLHTHSFYGFPQDKFIELLRTYPGIKVVLDKNSPDYLKFYSSNTSNQPENAVLVADAFNNGTLTVDALKEILTIDGLHDDGVEWSELNVRFDSLRPLLKDNDLSIKIYEECMRSYIENNVSLVEMRLTFMSANDEDNMKKMNPIIEAYKRVKKDNPDFKVRFVACSVKSKTVSIQDAFNALQSGIRLSKTVKDETEEGSPNMIIGLDLVSEEDQSNPLEMYVDFFLSEEAKQSQLDFYLHSGESLDTKNSSVVDAYMVGAKRVGHGMNLFRFPNVLELYKKNDITIEVCPMSNYKLAYVDDLRLHPASGYVKGGLSVVIASDDALFMEENCLVDDYFAVITNWDLNISDLKALCRNSLEKSGLSSDQIDNLMKDWNERWATFVKKELENKA